MKACFSTLLLIAAVTLAFAADRQEDVYVKPINVTPRHFSSDPSIKLDYDIVYVRGPRHGNDRLTRWAEIQNPVLMEAGSDLMLLHPDGREDVLVPAGEGAVADPFVSFDGEWVYFSYFHNQSKLTKEHFAVPTEGADIFKIHVKTRKLVQLTEQFFTPNTGAANWSNDFRTPQKGRNSLPYGVFNLGPCPLPGGRVMFVSNRNGFKPPKHPYPTLQLFVMDDDGANVEQIGYLNIGMALHPTILMDGRVMFSSLESQGVRSAILWGLWTIHPDGTNWGPMISAFDVGDAPNAFHFQTQLSDGHIVVEEYYNHNNDGFGAYVKLPPQPADGYPAFGPGNLASNPALRFGRYYNGHARTYHLPFSPYGIESFTRFANNGEGVADPSVLGNEDSPRVGKLTHPSGAPDNHLLTVWSAGPVNHQYKNEQPFIDGGIYLIKSGQAIDEPGQMLLIKNDPNYNEQWPRALVPYKRIYGVEEPRRLPRLANDGKLSPHLPEGTPFGLIGTSSMYKRESYPNGMVPKNGVTAIAANPKLNFGYGDLDPFNTAENGRSLNWSNQGAEAGLYTNEDVHAIRILAMEPTTDNRAEAGRLFFSHANERLRILGEIPVRKFTGKGEPLDPDGNPDTSFLARIPADVAFSFQTLDKYGMVLNMAQTWHQLRPGEIRNDCGGCHAHSQKPTLFQDTLAAKPDYAVFDLTRNTPLLTTKTLNESKRKWDARDESGLRFQSGIKNVEYFRDIEPILDRSCAACHTHKVANPPGNLVLDDDRGIDGWTGTTYQRLAADQEAKYGYKPLIRVGEKFAWRQTNASRYIRMFQARRSLLIWKIYGKRLDGWSNDDFPTESVPGDPNTLMWKGKAIANTPENRNRADLDYTGSIMPPREAVEGSYEGPDGRKIKVAPLSAEDRLTLVRWIDLGCPIDKAVDRRHPEHLGFGWMCDDNRPTLTLTYPQSGENETVTRLLVGMHDYYGGLNLESFQVLADFPANGVAPGQNLAPLFKIKDTGVWELKLDKPITKLAKAKIFVSIVDRQGNGNLVERTFSVGSK